MSTLRYELIHLSTAGNYTLSTSPTPAGTGKGVGQSTLHYITINSISTGTISIWNATSSATTSSANVIAIIGASTAPCTLRYDGVMSQGTIITLAQAGDITVAYGS